MKPNNGNRRVPRLTALAFAASLGACSHLVPPGEQRVAETVQVDMDTRYRIDGPLVARPFVFAGRTVLEFSRPPGEIEVRDEAGVALPLSRTGRYVRLPGVVDNFTVWVQGRRMSVVASNPIVRPDGKHERREAVAASSTAMAVVAPTASPALTHTERQAAARDRSVVPLGGVGRMSLGFDRGATRLKIDRPSHDAIVDAAKAAAHVEVRGYTSSFKVTAASKRLARERALAAAHMLAAAGVERSRIRLSYVAAGGFVAPNRDRRGQALNRRVEIVLHGHSVAVSPSSRAHDNASRSFTVTAVHATAKASVSLHGQGVHPSHGGHLGDALVPTQADLPVRFVFNLTAGNQS
jgi:outer membrane protein OmpA-like peptidoglycan-associated protein